MLEVKAVFALAALAVLAGCADAQVSRVPGVTSLDAARSAAATNKSAWMSPAAKKQNLVYVSDLNGNDVLVYSYKTGLQVGQLTGFLEPAGQCVDAKGDVWITDSGDFQVVEYAHGGSAPLKTLATDGNGVGCSIDPVTGNLAVANSFSSVNGTGDIQIFKGASGVPTDYADKGECDAIFPPGYDNKGNLYFIALSSSYKLCELAAGASAIEPVTFSETIDAGGSVMWDGRHITVSAPNVNGTQKTAIYQAKRNGARSLKVVGTTMVADSCNGADALVQQPFIVGTKNTPVNVERGKVVVGANYSCARRFDRWAYPAGGQPIRTGSTADEVGGNAVSLTGK